jgi:fucose permease
MGSSQALLAVTVAGAFVFGLVIVLLSCLKPQLASRLEVPEQRVSGLWAGMNVLLVPMAFLGGLLADVWDVRVVFVLGCLLIALGLMALRWATTYRGALLAFLVTGVGGGFLSTASIVMMPAALFGRPEASASLNMGNVFFALGALIAPTLADVLLRSGGFRRPLSVGALLALLPLGLIAFVSKEDAGTASLRPDLVGLLSDLRLWLASAVFFLYAPLEGCLHTWGSTYLQNVGHSERKAGQLIAGFWSCFLLGRLAMAYLQHWRFLEADWDRWVVIVLSCCATVTVANLAGTVKRGSATTGLLLLGFFLGPIFPTLIGVLFQERLFGSTPGTAFGIVFAIGSAGSVVFAPLIGARFHRKSAHSALRIPLFLGLLLMLVSTFFGLTLG